MSDNAGTSPGEAPEAASDGTMPNVGPGLDHLLRALDGMAAMGDRLMTPAPNRAMRRAMKRAKRKKGK